MMILAIFLFAIHAVYQGSIKIANKFSGCVKFLARDFIVEPKNKETLSLPLNREVLYSGIGTAPFFLRNTKLQKI